MERLPACPDPIAGRVTLVVIKLLLLLIFMVVGASFAIINDAPVKVDLYFITPELPLSLLLLLALGLGIALGGLAGMVYFMRVKKENADLRRQARLVSEEVKNLRAMPIKGR
jgi:putative membrane protein